MSTPIDQFKDKDLAFAMLNDLKFTCDCLNQIILESSNMQLRQNYINILNETFNEHKQLFDFMSQRGWYQPMIAQQQELTEVYNKINHMKREAIQSIHMSNYQQQYLQDYQEIMYNRNNQGHQLY